MNKKRILLLTLVLGLIVFIFWPEPEPLYPTAGTNIVVFGDSLAEGVGAKPGTDIASRLSEVLGQKVINLGVSGDTTTDSLVRLDEVLEADPRVVVLLLGGNDALQKVPVNTTFSNLATIIERIQLTGAAIILVGEPGGLYGNQYEKRYEELTKDYRTFYIPNILSGLLGRSEYMSDIIHPNSAGYAVAADRILPVVEQALMEKQ